MNFESLSFPRENFPRFDNACAKSIELQKRYNNLMRQRRNLQDKKNAIVVLCKGKEDTNFPVDIKTLCFQMSVSSKVQKRNKFDSTNIEMFLSSLKEESVCVIIVDSKYKTKICHLLENKSNAILLAITDDAKKENKARYQSYLNVTIAKKENMTSEIDDHLERISLAPLKQICEHCYEMFQKKISTNMDTNAVRNGGQRFKEESSVKTENHHRSLQGDKLSDFHRSEINERHTIKMKNDTIQYVNGSTINTETSHKPPKPVQGTRKMGKTKRTSPRKTRSLFIRPRSRFIAHGKFKDLSHFDLNGNNSNECARISVRKSTRGQTLKRLAETVGIIAHKDKKRKEGGIHEQTTTIDCTNEEDPENLMEAILAIYGMSNVPESEKPRVPKQSKKINEKMKKELFGISPTIKRMGYRYRTFNIYAVKPMEKNYEKVRNNRIRSVMMKYKICPYEIAHCNEEFQEFIHTGAKIEARSSDMIYSLRSRTVSRTNIVKGGSLGGFVETNEGYQHYCLLSKHVTEGCSGIFSVENGDETFLGHMLQHTNNHIDGGLDISAALMNDPVTEECAKFKDTRGIPLKGMLHEYNEEDEDNICRSGQAVHIYGAASKPGIGEITIPITDHYLTSPLIQVEDRGGAGVASFAENGDSGAVLCVEDPGRRHIHAIGMLMGEVPDDSRRRKYLALPLSKGIQQIADQTGTQLELM